MATRQQQEQLIALTTAMFDAPPGADFLAEFEGYLDQGLSIEQVAANLAATDAFNAQFSGMESDDAKINMVLEGFGIGSESPAYQEAFNFFSESLAAGRNPGEVLLDAANFLSTTEDETFSTASATFKNKVETGITHSIELGLPSEDLAELKSVLANVTSDPQSVAAAAQALNEKKQELEQGEVEEDEGTGGSGGGTPTPPAFTASVDGSGVVTFGGSATGAISVEWSGTAGASIATFSRDGNVAPTKPDFSGTTSAQKISLSSTQTLADTAADLAGVAVEGNGTVNVTALHTTPNADLSKLTATAVTATLTESANISANANLNTLTALTVDDGKTSSVITATLSATQAHALNGNITTGTDDVVTVLIDAANDGNTAQNLSDAAITTIDINTADAVDLSDDTLAATGQTLDLDAGTTATNVTVTATQLKAFATVTADGGDSITVDELNGVTDITATDAGDTFVFASSDTGIGITGFTPGGTADVLDFTAFLGAGYTAQNDAATAIDEAGTDNVVVAGKVVFFNNTALSWADFNLTSSAFADIDTGKAVVIGSNGNIWFVDSTAGEGMEDITLVGTINNDYSNMVQADVVA